MNQSERYVQQLFRECFNLELKKIPEGAAPTPDFEIITDGTQLCVLEVKTFEEGCSAEVSVEEVSVENAEQVLMTGVLGDDNSVARVGDAINRAADQLKGYRCRKVLVLVNLDYCMDVNDLDEAYRGECTFVDSIGRESVDRSAARIANGRIKEKKQLIDVFVWVERWSARPAIRFRGLEGRALAERLFAYSSPTDGREMAR